MSAHFLIVDNDEDNRFLIWKSLLKSFPDATSKILSSGEDALPFLGTENFTAVVTDFRMNGMDGLELARIIREKRLTMPIVLCTATAKSEAAGIDKRYIDYLLSDGKLLEIGTVMKQLLSESRAA